MRVEAQTLKEFLDTVTLKQKILSAVLNFAPEGMIVRLKSSDDIGATFGILHNSAFKDYKPIEKQIGIKDTRMISSMLSSFKGVVEIEAKDNLLTIYNERTHANLTTAAVEFIDNHLAEEISLVSKYDGGVEVSTEVLSNGVSNMGTVNSNYLLLEVKDKKLTISTGGEGFDSMKEIVGCEYRDCSGKYGEVLVECISVLGKKVNLSFGDTDNFPILLKTKTEDYMVKMIVSPMKQGEEDKKEEVKEEPEEVE